MTNQNQTQPSIAVIGIYFGKLPEWFEVWYKTATANPTVDFLLFLDDEEGFRARTGGESAVIANGENAISTSNVHMIPFTLEQFKRLAEERLEMEVCLPRPYKLCDFKPVWGIILQEYVKGYDYWGHCDFDMLFGDIRGFAERYELPKYDKFLSLGHLALYRNAPECRNYFKLPGSKISYKEAFSRPEPCYFDEFDNINAIYRSNHLPIFADESIFANIDPARERLQRLSAPNYKQQLFFWENGKVYGVFRDPKGMSGAAGKSQNEGKSTSESPKTASSENGLRIEEFLYIHICKRKMEMHITPGTRGIYITPHSFEDKWCNENTSKAQEGKATVPVSVADIRKYNPYSLAGEIKDTLGIWKHNIIEKAYLTLRVPVRWIKRKLRKNA